MKQREKKILFSITIKDCDVDTFRCPGHGGQNVNKVESGVRITHRASGATGKSCDTRDQFRNKRIAFIRMAKSKEFNNWLRIESARRQGKRSIEQLIDDSLHPSNLRIEVRNEEGKWEVVNAALPS